MNEKTLRAIALTFTSGISRGETIIDTGGPITVPTGKEP